jgi:hypothetical protein
MRVKCIDVSGDISGWLVLGQVYRTRSNYSRSDCYELGNPHWVFFKWRFVEVPENGCPQCGERHE